MRIARGFGVDRSQLRPKPLDPYTLPPIVVDAVGPELAQMAHGRATRALALASGAQGQGRPRYGAARWRGIDVPSPQRFPTPMLIRHALDTAAVGIETGAGSLPGRLHPTAWDGESGYQSPVGGENVA